MYLYYFYCQIISIELNTNRKLVDWKQCFLPSESFSIQQFSYSIITCNNRTQSLVFAIIFIELSRELKKCSIFLFQINLSPSRLNKIFDLKIWGTLQRCAFTTQSNNFVYWIVSQQFSIEIDFFIYHQIFLKFW